MELPVCNKQIGNYINLKVLVKWTDSFEIIIKIKGRQKSKVQHFVCYLSRIFTRLGFKMSRERTSLLLFLQAKRREAKKAAGSVSPQFKVLVLY